MIPTMLIVRDNLSKAGHQYFTFQIEEACRSVKEYIEARLGTDETLTPKSALVTPNFKDKLPDGDRPIEWLTNRIEEVELSRNIIARHNPLSDDDLDRVKMYVKDWIKQFTSDR